MNHYRRFHPSVLVLALGLLIAGCEEDSYFDRDSLGSANVHVQIAGVTVSEIDRVTLTVTGVGISPAIVEPMEPRPGGWFASVGDIPAGINNRTVRARAFDRSGGLQAELSLDQVSINLLHAAEVFLFTDVGVRSNPGSENGTPVIEGLSASSVEAYPEEVITLAAKALVPGSHTALKYAWSADGGFFYSASSAVVSWNAPPRIGSYRIWLTVSEPAGKQVRTSLTIEVLNVPNTAGHFSF